jgi:hypothetical protein
MTLIIYLLLLNGPQYLFTYNDVSSGNRGDKMRTIFRFSGLTDDVQNYVIQTFLWPLSVPHVIPDMGSCGVLLI